MFAIEPRWCGVVMTNLQEKNEHFRNQAPVGFDVFDWRDRALLYKLEERPKSGLIILLCCKCPHSSSLQERFSRLSISTHQSANGGVVDQKPPVRTSVERVRRCFGCPLLCQRAGLVLAQLRVPAPHDSWTP